MFRSPLVALSFRENCFRSIHLQPCNWTVALRDAPMELFIKTIKKSRHRLGSGSLRKWFIWRIGFLGKTRENSIKLGMCSNQSEPARWDERLSRNGFRFVFRAWNFNRFEVIKEKRKKFSSALDWLELESNGLGWSLHEDHSWIDHDFTKISSTCLSDKKLLVMLMLDQNHQVLSNCWSSIR